MKFIENQNVLKRRQIAEKDWSTKGVKTRKTESGMIECLSDHLTSFSILLDPTPMDRISGYHEHILRLISYIGSGLSILGLSITVLLYSLFRYVRSLVYIFHF